MKTINLLVIAITLCFSFSTRKTDAQKVTFGIFETVRIKEIPVSVMEAIQKTSIQPEKDLQLPIIGYILKTDSVDLKIDLSKENFRFVKTYYPVDKEGKYYAIAATKQEATIDNSDIQNTVNKGTNVEIYFNMKGAKKWADMTKKNTGNMIAFIINGKIYTMPLINGEIRNGVALINRLENEAVAKRISESLNSSIPE